MKLGCTVTLAYSPRKGLTLTCEACHKKHTWSGRKKLHNGWIPFQCEHCDEKYQWTKKLMKHEKYMPVRETSHLNIVDLS